jgi:hypothetical protein
LNFWCNFNAILNESAILNSYKLKFYQADKLSKWSKRIWFFLFLRYKLWNFQKFQMLFFNFLKRSLFFIEKWMQDIETRTYTILAKLQFLLEFLRGRWNFFGVYFWKNILLNSLTLSVCLSIIFSPFFNLVFKLDSDRRLCNENE